MGLRCVILPLGTIATDTVTAGRVGHVGIVCALGQVPRTHISPVVAAASVAMRRFPARNGAIHAIGAVRRRDRRVVVRWIFGSAARLGATVPATSLARPFAREWLMTFALMFVITAVATDRRCRTDSRRLAIGLVVGFDALAGGAVTGASMNPARSLGPAVGAGVWTRHRAYWAAPITATIGRLVVRVPASSRQRAGGPGRSEWPDH